MAEGTDGSWQQRMRDWDSKVKLLFDTKLFADCTLKVGNDENKMLIRAHKMVLSTSSQVFEEMFYGPFASDEIELTNVDKEAFSKMIEWIYCGHFQAPLSNVFEALEVYEVAKTYGIRTLVAFCTYVVKKDTDVSSAFLVFEFARLTDDAVIRSISTQVLTKEAQKLLEDESFNEMNPDTLSEFLDLENLNIKSEVELFKAVINWANFQRSLLEDDVRAETTLKEILGEEIIGKIRFCTFSKEDFAKYVRNSGLFTTEEEVMIFQCLTHPQMNSLPGICSNCRVPRVYEHLVSWFNKVTFYRGIEPEFKFIFRSRRDVMLLGLLIITEGNTQGNKVSIMLHDLSHTNLLQQRVPIVSCSLALSNNETNQISHEVPSCVKKAYLPNPVLLAKGNLFQLQAVTGEIEQNYFISTLPLSNQIWPFNIFDIFSRKIGCVAGFVIRGNDLTE